MGVRKLPSGKFGAEIWNPSKKKSEWLGTYETKELATEAFEAKRVEVERKKTKKLIAGESSNPIPIDVVPMKQEKEETVNNSIPVDAENRIEPDFDGKMVSIVNEELKLELGIDDDTEIDISTLSPIGDMKIPTISDVRALESEFPTVSSVLDTDNSKTIIEQEEQKVVNSVPSEEIKIKKENDDTKLELPIVSSVIDIDNSKHIVEQEEGKVVSSIIPSEDVRVESEVDDILSDILNYELGHSEGDMPKFDEEDAALFKLLTGIND